MISNDLSINFPSFDSSCTNVSPVEDNSNRFFVNLEKELDNKNLDLKRFNDVFESERDDLDDFIEKRIKTEKESLLFADRIFNDETLFCFKRSFELYGDIIDVDSENRRFIALMSSDFDSNKRNVWFSFDEIRESDLARVVTNARIVYSSIKEFIGGEQRNVVKIYFVEGTPLNSYQLKNIKTIANSVFERVRLNDVSNKSNRKKR